MERAVGQYERATRATGETHKRLVSLGSLHLRGVVLASRHRDAAATGVHVAKAKELAARLPSDVLAHNLTFGPGNVALYELAAQIELDRPGDAVKMAMPLLKRPPRGLRPTRVGRLAIDAARAHLAVRKYEAAERALGQAFAVAPEMAAVHPMSREVIRVLFVLNQRARPRLLEMARRVGSPLKDHQQEGSLAPPPPRATMPACDLNCRSEKPYRPRWGGPVPLGF